MGYRLKVYNIRVKYITIYVSTPTTQSKNERASLMYTADVLFKINPIVIPGDVSTT